VSQASEADLELFDRRDRRAYIPEPDQAMISFALMEPDEGDALTDSSKDDEPRQ
jgi:hypothetical protein